MAFSRGDERQWASVGFGRQQTVSRVLSGQCSAGAMGAGVNAGSGFGDANQEQSQPQRREQCIRQQSEELCPGERGVPT